MKDIKVYLRLLREPSLLSTLLEWNSIIIRDEFFQELLRETPLPNEKDLPNFENKRLYSESNLLSIGIIKYLLENEFKILEKIYKNKKESIIFVAPINKRATYKRAYTYTKRDFIKLINRAYEDGLISQDEYNKTYPLQEATTYEKFLEDYQDESITIKHNNDEVNISSQSFLDLLSLSKEELEEILKSKQIASMPKEKYINALNEFFAKNHILEKYFLPKEMLDNLAIIQSKVDTYAYEGYFTKLPNYTKEINVNDELWQDIWSKVPEDFTTLEKAYYIYYQLCKIFTYDEEWYASTGLAEPPDSKHKDIFYLEELNKDENQVVCYEFNAIYSKFLESLGIEYEYTINCRYAGGHEGLNFIANQFYVSADSTIDSIIYGDMPAAKQGLPLTGFKLLNYKASTQEEFDASIKKVNDYIKKEEEQDKSFSDLVNQYKTNLENPKDLSSEERLNILLTSLEKSTLPPTDSLGYVHTLIKNLFSKTSAYCEDFFLRDNYIENGEKRLGISIIIYYSSNDELDSEPVKYYLYKPTKELTQITREQLEERIFSGQYQTINDHNQRIPRINYEKGETYASKNPGNNKQTIIKH